MVEQGFRGWANREITDPQHIRASLRYASLKIPEKTWDNTSFAFPYHRLLNDEQYLINVRSGRSRYRRSSFSLDLVQFNEEDRWFQSYAWIDFSIATSGMKKREYGIACRADSVFGDPSVQRHRNQFLNWGIFVNPDMRRLKIATSLISYARVLLHNQEVKSLILGEIHHLEKGHPQGDFYRDLNVHAFNTHPVWDYRTRYKAVGGTGAIPTAETSRWPYRFE